MKKLKLQTLKYKDDPKDVCKYYARSCYIELFGWRVHFIFSDDIIKVRNSKLFVKALGEDDRSNKYSYAFVETMFQKGDMRSFVFLPWDHDTLELCPEAIIAHECNHVVWHLAEQIGMKDEETSCYLLQMLVSHANILRDDVKKALTTDKDASTLITVAGG